VPPDRLAVVVWVYHSAQIFFFGAQFKRVCADAHAKSEGAPHGRVAVRMFPSVTHIAPGTPK